MKCDINGYPIKNHDCETVNVPDDQQLPYPHYSNSYWDTPKLIWGKFNDNISAQYSDRLESFDYDKAEITRNAANEKYKLITPGYWKVYIKSYYDDKMTLKYIMGGVNRSDGFPYWIFGLVNKE